MTDETMARSDDTVRQEPLEAGVAVDATDAERKPAEPFGERLRRLRESRDVDPSTQGALVGVTQGAIRQMKSGQTHVASLRVGVRLALVLGVTPAYLAFGDSDGRDDPKVCRKPYVVSVDTRDRWDEMEERFTRIGERMARVENRLRHLPK